MYTLDKKAAMNADQGSKWLTETGKYIGKILCAEAIEAKTGTKGVALTLQANDGRETRQYVYTLKADGTELSGYDLLMATMTCVRIKQLSQADGLVKRWNSETREEYTEQATVLPELANKPIGFLLQKTEEQSRKNPGTTAWSAKLVGVFEATTELTATEILNQKTKPEGLALRIATLADRPMKAKTTKVSTHATPGSFDDMDDDIPF